MRNAALAILLVVAALGAGSGARASTTMEVYPTGQYPADVQNVQRAVDQGGTVLLKAANAAGTPTAFNFGPSVRGLGFVTLQRDVELVGEGEGSAVTTIDGGFYPVRGFGAISASVRDISFDSPLRGAIYFVGPAASSVEILRTRISHVVGGLIPGVGTVAEAMVVAGGRVAIDDNAVVDVAADFGIGITELDSAGPVEVLRNYVSGTSTNSIECTRNHGVVRIENNVVRPGPTPDGFGGYGIEINGTGAYEVAGNDVLIETAGGVGIFALGALGFGFGPVTNPLIEKNDVVLRPAGSIGGSLFDDGIDLGGLVSGAYVGQNKIEGSGSSAFGLFDVAFDHTQPTDLGFNTFVGNDIADLQSQLADIYLDHTSHDTVLKGKSGTVIDLGVNNRITGFTKGSGPGSGEQVSAATHRRNLAKQAAHETVRKSPITP